MQIFVFPGGMHNVVLVGRSNGKTSCRNTLTGRYLKSTTKPSTIDFEFEDIPVFDLTPINDMCIYEEMVQFYDNAIKFMNEAKTGVTAFLLVLRYVVKYTKQDHDLILSFKEFFGPDFISKYCIILITYGDVFSDDYKLFTFKEWCVWQDGHLEFLYNACNKRFVLMFNNGDESTKQTCRDEVFELVKQLSQQQEPYTLKDFKNYQLAREEYLVSSPSTDKIGVIQYVFIRCCQDAEEMVKSNDLHTADVIQTRAQYFKDKISAERDNLNKAIENSDAPQKEKYGEINKELNKLENSFNDVEILISRFVQNKISCTEAEKKINSFRKDVEIDGRSRTNLTIPLINSLGHWFKSFVTH